MIKKHFYKIGCSEGSTPAGTARRLRLQAQAVPAESVPVTETNFFSHQKNTNFLRGENLYFCFVSIIFSQFPSLNNPLLHLMKYLLYQS